MRGVFNISRGHREAVVAKLTAAGVTEADLAMLADFVLNSADDPWQGRRRLAGILDDEVLTREALAGVRYFYAHQPAAKEAAPEVKHYPGWPVPYASCRCPLCENMRKKVALRAQNG